MVGTGTEQLPLRILVIDGDTERINKFVVQQPQVKKVPYKIRFCRTYEQVYDAICHHWDVIFLGSDVYSGKMPTKGVSASSLLINHYTLTKHTKPFRMVVCMDDFMPALGMARRFKAARLPVACVPWVCDKPSAHLQVEV